MKILYKPSGAALEYAELGLNLVGRQGGCLHGCIYCYCPQAMRMNRKLWFSQVVIRNNLLALLEQDCRQLDPATCPTIQLSFIGDPYQPNADVLQTTRQVIQLLIKYNLPFTILTKGGTRAFHDFDLLQGYSRCSLGTSLVWIDSVQQHQYEPGAASVRDRAEMIHQAKKAGIRTWMSLEPVIDPHQALQLIEYLYPDVDHWKIGRINHCKEVGVDVDWKLFTIQSVNLLNSVHADYYIKESLRLVARKPILPPLGIG